MCIKKHVYCVICNIYVIQYVKLKCGCCIHDECFTHYLTEMITDGILDIGLVCPFLKNKKCIRKIPKKTVKKYVSKETYLMYCHNKFKRKFRIPCCRKKFGTVAGIDFVKCPTCDTLINKHEGCTHIICTRCITHFCYLCGNKYNIIFKDGIILDHSNCKFKE